MGSSRGCHYLTHGHPRAPPWRPGLIHGDAPVVVAKNVDHDRGPRRSYREGDVAGRTSSSKNWMSVAVALRLSLNSAPPNRYTS